MVRWPWYRGRERVMAAAAATVYGDWGEGKQDPELKGGWKWKGKIYASQQWNEKKKNL